MSRIDRGCHKQWRSLIRSSPFYFSESATKPKSVNPHSIYPLFFSFQGGYDQCRMFDKRFLPDPFSLYLNNDSAILDTSEVRNATNSSISEQQIPIIRHPAVNDSAPLVQCKSWDFDHSVFEYTINEQVCTCPYTYIPSRVTPDHLLLDSATNLGPLITRWKINKSENC